MTHRRSSSRGSRTRKAPSKDASYLEPALGLANGMPIMLKKNIDYESGMVCGALGTVEDVQQPDGSVLVTLRRGRSSQGTTVRITHWTAPISASPCTDNLEGTRTQLPLRAAFAETVFKAQGFYRENIELML